MDAAPHAVRQFFQPDTILYVEVFDKKYAGVLLIAPDGRVIMQKRDNKPGITNPGKVTTFVGSVEAGDTPEEAAAREIKEELSLDLTAKSISLFKVFNKRKETHGEDSTCYIYLAKDIDVSAIEVKEGQGYVQISRDDDLEKLNLSVLTAEILREYFRG